MSKQWFCQVADQEIGPISSGELKALAAEGKLCPEDLVRKDGQEDWATASQVKGLTFTTSAISPVTPSASTITPVEATGPPRLPPERPPAMVRSDRPSQTLSSKGEASTETRPKGSGAADEIKRVARSWLGHVGPVVKRVLQEARNIGIATWEQGVRLAKWAGSESRVRQTKHRESEAREKLGEQLFAEGSGDASVRNEITKIDVEIQTSGTSSLARRQRVRLRKQMIVALADQSLDEDASSKSVKECQETVSAARANVSEASANAATCRRALWRYTTPDALRATTGVGVLFLGAWLCGSTIIHRLGDTRDIVDANSFIGPPSAQSVVIVPDLAPPPDASETQPDVPPNSSIAAKAMNPGKRDMRAVNETVRGNGASRRQGQQAPPINRPVRRKPRLKQATELAGLLRDLRDADPGVRQAAALRLGGRDCHSYHVKTIPALCSALRDDVTAVRVSAARSLGEIGKPDHNAIGAIASAFAEQRINNSALDILFKLGGAMAVLRVLDERNDDAKEAALNYVEENYEPDEQVGAVVGVVVPLLSTKKYAMWSYAGYILLKCGPAAEPAVDPIIASVSRPDRDKKRELDTGLACEILAAIGPRAKAAVPMLISLIETTKPGDPMRAQVFRAIAAMGRAARPALPSLVKALTEEHERRSYMVDSAILAVGAVGPDAASAVPLIVEAAEKSPFSPGPRESALWAIGNIGPGAKSAIPFIIRDLRKFTHEKRVVESLVRIGPVCIPAVMPLLGDEDARVASTAIIALARI